MREIISIQCGQAATAFWSKVLGEHGITLDGELTGSEDVNNRLDVYFTSIGHRKYVPRAVCIDLEPATIDSLRSGPLGQLFRPDNLVSSTSGAGNTWAKGFYSEGAEVLEPIMDIVRREAEAAESLQGFQLTHSLGGGTGSGLGTALIGRIKEEFPDRMVATYSVLPSPRVSDTVTEPYNAVLALNQLVETSDATFCLDNEALYSIAARVSKKTDPTYRDLNDLIASVMSGVTTPFRFPGQLNGDLRKLAVNLVPFPRLHFFTVGHAPIVSASAKNFQALSVRELTNQIFEPGNTMAACNLAAGRYLAVSAMYRGKISLSEIDESIQHAKMARGGLFVDWIPNNMQYTLCDKPEADSVRSATFVANTTAVQELFTRNVAQFTKMFRRKAFLEWYLREGMEELEFEEAESNLRDLVSEYEQYQNVTAEDDYDEYAAPDGYEEPVEVEMEVGAEVEGEE